MRSALKDVVACARRPTKLAEALALNRSLGERRLTHRDGKLTGRKIPAHDFVHRARDTWRGSRSKCAAQDHVHLARDCARAFVFWIDIFGDDDHPSRTPGLVRSILACLRLADHDGNVAGSFRFAHGQAGGAQIGTDIARRLSAKRKSKRAKIEKR